MREQSDHFTEAVIAIGLGAVYRTTDARRSRGYLTEIVDVLADKELPSLLADALIGLGDTEQAAGDLDAATVAYIRAREVVSPLDPDRAAELTQRIDRVAS